MIQTYIWKITTPQGRTDVEVAATLTRVAAGIKKITNVLLELTAEPHEDHVMIEVRVSGRDRWAVQGNARKLAERLLHASRLRNAQVSLEAVIVPPNRSALRNGEGRTVRPRPPRVNPMPT